MKTEWAQICEDVKELKARDFNLRSGLGEAIRRERAALGISQHELARRSGLHRTYVSDLERGARNPSIGSIQKIAQALAVPVSKLFEIVDYGTA
jgi:transcriptional regulator with XRE-family HTH domain